MSNDYGIKVSKRGVDVETATPKQLIFSSQFDTMKIRKTGTLTLNLPGETFGGEPYTEFYRIHEATYMHNLGYIPIFLPRVTEMVSYLGEEVSHYRKSFIVNDLEEKDIPIYGYGLVVGEYVSVIMKSDRLILRVVRENYSYEPLDVFFAGRKATLYYTIFYNKINEELDLISD